MSFTASRIVFHGAGYYVMADGLPLMFNRYMSPASRSTDSLTLPG